MRIIQFMKGNFSGQMYVVSKFRFDADMLILNLQKFDQFLREYEFCQTTAFVGVIDSKVSEKWLRLWDDIKKFKNWYDPDKTLQKWVDLTFK